MRRAASVVVVLAVVLACASGAIAAPALNGTFAVSDMPGKIAAGPDGNMWVVVGGSKVARVKPDGTVDEFDLAPVTSARGITGGPDGNLWVTAAGSVLKVPPAAPLTYTATALADITAPQAIATGPDGNLWTASAAKVLKIPPAAPATATTFPVAGLDARDIASSGGLLWVADHSGRIVSVTPPGTATPYLVGGGPAGIGGGPGGQVLYTNAFNIDPYNVGRLVAGGTPLLTNRPLADPAGVALGADGAYWVAEFAAGDLLRVTTDGAATTLPGLGAGDPREIAAGPGNTLWVTLEQSKKVARITGVDPQPPVVVTPPVVIPPVVTPVVTPVDTTAPRLTGLRVTPRQFRRGSGKLARIAAAERPAAKVALTLSEAATVTFTAERIALGVRVGGRCVAPSPKHLPTKRTSCMRGLPFGGSVAVALGAGPSALRFSGRLARALPQGGIYRLVAVARDSAGNAAAPVRTPFGLLPPRRRCRKVCPA